MEKKLDPILRDIADHLGFLGYEAEICEGKQSPYIFLRHQRNPDFVLDTFGGAVKFAAFLGLSSEAQAEPPELLSLLNELNRKAIAFKFYSEGKNLVLEAVFPRDYTKLSFGAFWSMVESDFRLFMDGRMTPFME
jgi:hypothetical protein